MIKYNEEWNGARNKSWGCQCLDDYAGSLVLWLTHARPGVSPAEAIAVMKNEGYDVNETTYEVTKCTGEDGRIVIDDLKAPAPKPKPVYKGKFCYTLNNVARGSYLLTINKYDRRGLEGSKRDVYQKCVDIFRREYHMDARIEEEKIWARIEKNDGTKCMIPIIKYHLVV